MRHCLPLSCSEPMVSEGRRMLSVTGAAQFDQTDLRRTKKPYRYA
jgi:hypothetical protein